MIMKVKKLNKTSLFYAQKIRDLGYRIRFNLVDSDGWFYADVSVTGQIWKGYGCEFTTPRKAYEFIKKYS